MQVRNKPLPVKREAEGEAGIAARELERYQAMTEREKLEFQQSSDDRPAGGGPVKVEPAIKKQRTLGLGGRNLLEIYLERQKR